MGGTTSLGLPYPVGTDKVRDGDNAIKALADAVNQLLISIQSNVTAGANAIDALKIAKVEAVNWSGSAWVAANGGAYPTDAQMVRQFGSTNDAAATQPVKYNIHDMWYKV